MMRKIQTVLVAAIVLLLVLSGCHEHAWVEADCITAKTCSDCGETEGEPLGHKWQEATCTEAKTCSRCGETEGEPLGHDWVEATCTEPKTCARCGETEGEPLEHDYSWNTKEEATCSGEGTEEGICSVCGAKETRHLEKLSHIPDGDWVVTKEAVGASEGTRVRYCSVCGEVAEEESYKLSPEEQAASFKSTCETYTYDEIARRPDDYLLKAAKFKGKVVQVMEDGDEIALRINVTQGRYTWSDTIYAQYTQDSSEGRILEDDIITVYGYLAGTVTYKSVLGASITIPSMLVSYVEFNLKCLFPRPKGGGTNIFQYGNPSSSSSSSSSSGIASS